MPARRAPGAVVPRIWILLMDLWDIPEPCRSLWWQALTAAAWSETGVWRQQVALAEILGDPTTVAHALWTPARCLHSLELLTREGWLSMKPANQLMDMVLRKCDAIGVWK